VKPLLHFVLGFQNTKPLVLQNKSNKMKSVNNKEIGIEKLLQRKKEETKALRKMLEKLNEKKNNEKTKK